MSGFQPSFSGCFDAVFCKLINLLVFIVLGFWQDPPPLVQVINELYGQISPSPQNKSCGGLCGGFMGLCVCEGFLH